MHRPLGTGMVLADPRIARHGLELCRCAADESLGLVPQAQQTGRLAHPAASLVRVEVLPHALKRRGVALVPALEQAGSQRRARVLGQVEQVRV
ncbi:hypothetical protein A1Q1_00139 [Trichosporon asahii var. asahii CBS 2479]|uniref:Uncharacterized protein n=1 Tax=Trichosporon asahii var. asahii (strain ATCC 90039 / CBS 2479 / JCM 2466 / KCTC 7840 / NBRC 103889/ NCYC 2677 / UAMH 7654) TaxID=1186058 RepID=J5R3P9_TRIAS|nr:hypothetical protein A1Q1_00139 [Trichosporon asahii var. asahii CBS 2479]EJT50518.1 hypothetical protein A1Q1_00139 [Trichosporon asahii var. asahii CBS 2479]